MSKETDNLEVLTKTLSEIKDGVESFKKSTRDEVEELKKSLSEKDEVMKEAAERVGNLEKKAYSVNYHGVKDNYDEVAAMFKSYVFSSGRSEFDVDAYVEKSKSMVNKTAANQKYDIKPGSALLFNKFVGSYNTQVLPEGGFVTNQPQISNTVTSREFDFNDMRTHAEVQTVGNIDIFRQPVNYGLYSIQDSNNQRLVQRIGDNPSDVSPFGEIEYRLNQKTVEVPVSDDMRNYAAIDFMAWVNNTINDSFRYTLSRDYLTGNATTTARGILTYADWTSPNTFTPDAIERIQSDGAALVYDDFINLKSSLRSSYQSNAKWFMNRFTWGEVLKLVDLQGRPLINQDQLGMNPDGMILGKPVVVFDDMPNIGTGNLPIMYGDMQRAYKILESGADVVKIATDFRQHIVISVNRKIGGGAHYFDAVKILEMSA